MSEAIPTVLVVDDDISVREALDLLIRSAGWCAETFCSAEDFLSRARPDAKSCLIVDVNLPGLCGLDLHRLVANKWPMLPVIVMTGNQEAPITAPGPRAPSVDLLAKPFSGEAVLLAIGRALEHSG
jgi:FixJ family two-component response regulator